MTKPTVLIILDGWGIRPEKTNNGIELSSKPHYDSFLKNYPHTAIEASGPAVGLPPGIMGNSEVGHMNLGAGRIVYTGLSQIYKAIEEGTFFTNDALLSAIDLVVSSGRRLHLMGLVSDGAVHSHQDHLYALLELAKSKGVREVFIHCFMDGRDTPPMDGIKYLQNLRKIISEKGVGTIASVSGRFYAMDRDKRWDRVQKAYDVLTGFHCPLTADPEAFIRDSYSQGIGDEFLIPHAVVDNAGKPVGSLQAGDGVIFFNFRADRARQITQALTDPAFQAFNRSIFFPLGSYVCMAPYDASFKLPVAFTPHYPQNVLADVLSQRGLKQLHIAETEKYAHVTFFFNGGNETPFPGEDRMLIPSPREVATYDLKPEMSAPTIASQLVSRLKENIFDFVVANFANSDMVGHTAKPEAIVAAIETLDHCLGEVVKTVLDVGGQVVITADHGNSEQMVDEQGEPHTAHTLNPVPFIVLSPLGKKISLKSEGGRLCDVAPTLLELMGIPIPQEMTGESLLLKN